MMADAITTLTDAFEDPSIRHGRDDRSRPTRRGRCPRRPCRSRSSAPPASASGGRARRRIGSDAGGRRLARAWPLSEPAATPGRGCADRTSLGMRRASSCRGRRRPTTKAFLYLRELVRRGALPTACPPMPSSSTCCSRTAPTCGPTTWRARRRCSTSCRRRRADSVGWTISATRSRVPMRPVRRPDAWPRSARIAGAPRVTGTEAFPLLAAFWEHGARFVRRDGQRRGPTGSRRARRCAGPRVLLTGAPVDGGTLHQAIESHRCGRGRRSRAVGQRRGRETTCASTTTRWRRSPIGIAPAASARSPAADSLTRWTARMLD